jgi:hypothetical protein
MEYISHEDFKGFMDKLQAETPKGMLKESVEEGNAFTAGLAKAKKGEEFKVDGKTVKDTSNYDAPIKEVEGQAKVLGPVKGTTSTYRVLDNRSTSTVDSYNFTGNFVWVRGYVAIDAGSVFMVQLNH